MSDDSYPCLLVGLGNPGKHYEQTRHNVGFMVIDKVISETSAPLSGPEQFAKSQIWHLHFSARDVILQKPQCFMNLSGGAVAAVSRKKGIDPSQILTIYDDLDLPFGKIRLRKNGGSGGHRGVESVISSLQTTEFHRLRIGIGRESGRENQADHVLSPFAQRELELLERVIEVSMQAALLAVNGGTETSMNRFNGLVITEECYDKNNK